MKSFLNRNYPWLAKWFPFFQRKERTSGDIDYKEIDATKLQEICALIQRSESPAMYPKKFDRDNAYIKASGLEKNITLIADRNSPSDNPKVDGIAIKHLKIEGDVEIVFETLKDISIENNEFSGNVTIQATDSTFTTVFKNDFLKCFDLLVHDAQIVIIGNNDIPRKMNLSFCFSPLLDNSDCHKIEQTSLGTQLPELFMHFSENEINYLDISDVSNALDRHNRVNNYPLENIRFAGSNHIKILRISTKHTTLTSYAQVKSDVNRISFNASDKIGISIPGANSTDDDVASSFYTNNDYQLAYGKFFSLLEAQAFEQHDRINEEMYMRKSRYFLRRFSPHREDRCILIWTNLISKDGTSWFRPLWQLVVAQALLATIAHYSFAGYDLYLGKECIMHWDMQCKPYIEEGWEPFLALVAWFMNPASLLPLIPITMTSWPIYLLFLCHKLFAAVFYYLIIKALRRFFRRP